MEKIEIYEEVASANDDVKDEAPCTSTKVGGYVREKCDIIVFPEIQ